MPNFKGHMIGGLLSFGLMHKFCLFNNCCFPFFSFGKIIELMLCLGGAMVPDIDIASRPRRYLDRLIFVVVVTSFYFKFWPIIIFALAFFSFTRLVGHRKITHNPFFMIVAPYCLMGFISSFFKSLPKMPTAFYFAFIIGILSHLILDAIPKKFLPKFMFY